MSEQPIVRFDAFRPIEDDVTEYKMRTESDHYGGNSSAEEPVHPRSEALPPTDEAVRLATTGRSWPFFLGGEADGSAEHRFVVEDLIHEDSMSMIFGRQGSLKTQLALDIAAHAGQGIRYQGLETTRGASLYIAAEGAGAIGKRVAGIYVEHPELPRDAIVCVSRAVNLVDSDEAAAFAGFVVQEVLPALSMSLRLIIYDTLSKSVPGASDSDDNVINLVESNARMIARRIADVSEDPFVPASLVIHHPRKNDETYRGSGAIEGNFDMILHVEKTDAERLEDRLFEVRLDKVKDGPTERRWAYRAALIDVGTTPRGKVNRVPVVRYCDEAEAIEARAEAKTKGRSLTQSVRHMIELIVRIETRDGRVQVPREVLASSGFTTEKHGNGWDSDMPVNGIRLESLRDTFYSEDDKSGRSPDGSRTVSDALRKRWERRRNALKNSKAAWIYDGWVWLNGD